MSADDAPDAPMGSSTGGSKGRTSEQATADWKRRKQREEDIIAAKYSDLRAEAERESEEKIKKLKTDADAERNALLNECQALRLREANLHEDYRSQLQLSLAGPGSSSSSSSNCMHLHLVTNESIFALAKSVESMVHAMMMPRTSPSADICRPMESIGTATPNGSEHMVPQSPVAPVATDATHDMQPNHANTAAAAHSKKTPERNLPDHVVKHMRKAGREFRKVVDKFVTTQEKTWDARFGNDARDDAARPLEIS